MRAITVNFAPPNPILHRISADESRPGIHVASIAAFRDPPRGSLFVLKYPAYTKPDRAATVTVNDICHTTAIRLPCSGSAPDGRRSTGSGSNTGLWLRAVVGLIFVLLYLVYLPAAYAQGTPALDPHKALTQYLIDAWTVDDGLPQGSVIAIVQTPEGYLWLGTQEGLARFDGLELAVFDKRRGALPNNSVSTLVYGHDGALWIGTRGGGLVRHFDGDFTTYSTQHGLASESVSSLVQDRDGNLWVGTHDGGLSRLNRDRLDQKRLDHPAPGMFMAFAVEDGLPSNRISALYQTRDGALWIGTRDAGLARYAAGTFTAVAVEGLHDADITAMHQTRDGALWVGTRSGALNRLVFDDGPDSGWRITSYTTDEGLPPEPARALYEDAAGSLWVGTHGGGLCRLREGRFTCITTDQGLTHHTIIALYGDPEGSLWVGTDGGGLNRLREGNFTHYTTQEGLAFDFVYTIYEAGDGTLWAGTEGGGLSRLKDGRFTTYTTADGLAHDEVLSVMGTRDGSIWVGTRDGLSRLKDGRFTTYTTADGLPRNDIWGLYADAQDNLWMATNGGLVRFREGVFTTFTTEVGLATNEVTAIAADAGGDLWVGTYTAGIHRVREGRVLDHYRLENSTNFVLCIYIDGEDTVWFTTRDGGLHRIKEGALTTYTVKDGLFSDTITQILEDGDGTLWLGSSVGLSVLSKQDVDRYAAGRLETLAPRVYKRPDGLRSQEFMGGTQPAGWRGRDGRLWFPTVGAGIVSVEPEHLRVNEYRPQVVIEEARANDVPIPTTGTVMLPPDTRRFAFHYVGLSLLAPKQVRYRYKLEGADENWTDAGTRREAFYTNLEPGLYTFKVRARNSDGIWSREAATMTFYLEPYFYETSWFYVLSVFGGLVLTLLFHRLRVGHLKRRERDLLDLVEARTADLRQEKERTEQGLLETEKARHEAERQQVIAEEAKAVIEEQAVKLQEMDRIKTRFFNNISHEFRTPLTLNIGPLENALLGVYGPITDEMKRQLEVMLRNARVLLRLINQLLDVAKLESGKMGLRIRHGNLVELLEGIVLSFTAFAEKKELNLAFQTERGDLSLNFDPNHLEKVFFNLLSNAVKFTPENGRITVSVADGEAGETVVIRFKDTGLGIPEAALPYIFDRFHQVDGTISRMQEGTGIGLSLVKELVVLHGGTIRVESAVGVGTEFIVTLPKDTRNLEATAEHRIYEDGAASRSVDITYGPMVEMAVFNDDDAASPQGMQPAQPSDASTVLVVDDNPEIRAFVAGCLEGTYRVVQAVNGQDALDKARSIMPDLIISDVVMPEMDGYGLCRAIKADEALNYIPVILLTSRASMEEKIKGLEAGSDDYLSKPFIARELQVRARNLLHLGMRKRELSALNEALQQANEELREASRMKSQLLRIAAHDLKNPLNGIREFAKILKREIDTDTANQELLDLIHTSSDQMLDMVSKLLDSEALESGTFTLHMEPVSVSAIAEEVVRRNWHQAQRKDERLNLHVEEGAPCMVMGSREWLRDAFDNLVSNAIKYSPPGKSIWVFVRQHGSLVRFVVRDEGPGLTDQDKQKLFGKFQRLSAMPTNNESSTGLGLSIVKQIVEVHEGRVWAESEVGLGSTFIVELGGTDARPVDLPVPAGRENRGRIPPGHGHRPPAPPEGERTAGRD